MKGIDILKMRYFAALAATAALASAHPVFAVPPTHRTPPPAAAPDPNWLHLTPAQQQRMNAREKKKNADIMALRNNKSLTDAQKMARFNQLQQAYEKDMEAILTPAQRKLVADQKAAMIKALNQRQQAINTRAKQIADARSSFIQSLTPSQKKTFQDLTDERNRDIQTLSANKSLTDAQRAAHLDENDKQREKKLMAALTPAQRKAFEKIMGMVPVP